MKTMRLALSIFLIFVVNTGFAAPINEMEIQESAAGIMIGRNTYALYFQTKLNDNSIVGFESVDWEHTCSTTDFYGQFNLMETSEPLPVLGFLTLI